MLTAADATWATVSAPHGSGETVYLLPPVYREKSVWFVGELSPSSYYSFHIRLNEALRVDDDGRMVHPEVLPYFWQAGPAGDFIRSWLRSRLPAIMVLAPKQEAAFQRAQLELNAANSDSIPQ